MYRESKEIPSTETKQFCLSDWRRWTDEAEQRGYFTWWDKVRAFFPSSCATGEAIRRYSIPARSGFPDDRILSNLSCEFVGPVGSHDFVGVRQLISAIEQRLAELA